MLRFASSLCVVLLLLLAGCQAAPPPEPPAPPQAASLACPPGTDPWQRLELIFGRSIPGGGRVSDKDWEGFVKRVLSPAFPDGLSVVPAEGRWLSPTGEHFVEDSLVVLVYLPAEIAAGEQIDGVIASYKALFQQEAVLFATSPSCLAFK